MWHIHALLVFPLDLLHHLVSVWINLVVSFIEEICFWHQFDNAVQSNWDVWNLNNVCLEEVGVDATKDCLMGHHNNWMDLPLNPMDHWLQSTYQVQVALATRITVFEFVLHPTKVSFRIFFFDLLICEGLTNTSIYLIQHFKADWFDSRKIYIRCCLYGSLQCRCQNAGLLLVNFFDKKVVK